jgi:hypothetical protein
MDHHSFFDGLGAGGNRFIVPLYLHKAEAAGGGGLTLFPNGTEVGDVDAVVESSPEDRVPLVGC